MKNYRQMNTTSNSLKEEAYKKILSDIKTCVLYPGERVAINDLSDRYEIGNTPIRDALQQLISDGLIHPIPRFGYIITPVTIHDIQELFEVRLILETAIVKLVIHRASDNKIDEISQAADFSYEFQDRSSYHNFLYKNFQFHNSIAEASGNRRLSTMLEGVNTQLDRVFYLGLDIKDSTNEMKLEHLELANALKTRNIELASESIKTQIIRSKERVIQALLTIEDDLL